MSRGDLLPIAVRTWTKGAKRRPQRRGRGDAGATDPRVILVFDTETTTDATQRLLFGAWRVYARPDYNDEIEGRPDWRGYLLAEEGLFFGDDLSARDPLGFKTLEDYARPIPGVRLESRAEWVERVFYPLAAKAHALVVGFNLPFDIARIAVAVGASKRRPRGFSFTLSQRRGADAENRFRPRVIVQSMDSKRAFIEFGSARDASPVDLLPDESETGERRVYRGRFLDLRTWAFALTDKSHSLTSACAAFETAHGKDVPSGHGVITLGYIEYGRRDVLATWELYTKLREEYELHPITLPPTRAYSPASVGKGYLDAMHIKPILERQPDFPDEVLGYAMAAYFGGRAECRIRRLPVPVVYVDFLSMYPTVNTLMGNWAFLTCERIEVQSATEAVRAFIDHVELEDLFQPETWKQLPCLVRIRADGETLPARARYDQSAEWQIGVNPLTADTPLWYTLADVVGSKFLGGKTPEVLEAIRLVPGSTHQRGLEPVQLRGSQTVDPRRDDFFQRVIELRRGTEIEALPESGRQRLSDFLKVLANSASYGIFAETNTQDGSADVTVERYGLDRLSVITQSPEEPGRWCFPPLAAFIAGSARLMLAMLERCVSDLGGVYAFCDTDSMAIVATEQGGTAGGSAEPHRLSWADVDSIVARFERLKPYDRNAVASTLLKVEDENFDQARTRVQLHCYAISAKRYCLYNLAPGAVLRKYSESGLGHLLDPMDPDWDGDIYGPEGAARQAATAMPAWMQCFWEDTLTEVYGEGLPSRDWFDRPALSRFTVSNHALLGHFRGANAGKPYGEQVKPANFMLIARDATLGSDRVVPVAAYERDATKWRDLDWRDRLTGTKLRIATRPSAGGQEKVRVVTYGSHFALHRLHLEAKSLAPDGGSCRPRTDGVLRRRPVVAATVEHIGKEANRLDEVAVGLVGATNVYNVYEADRWGATRDVLKLVPIRVALELTGLTRAATMEIRAGRSDSSARRRIELSARVAQWCRDQLRSDTPAVSGWTDGEVLSMWTRR